jgi:hypothetical protein
MAAADEIGPILSERGVAKQPATCNSEGVCLEHGQRGALVQRRQDEYFAGCSSGSTVTRTRSHRTALWTTSILSDGQWNASMSCAEIAFETAM